MWNVIDPKARTLKKNRISKKNGTKCMVLFCENTGNLPGVSFFSLASSRHDAWLKALGRNPQKESLSRHNRICSEHFVNEDLIMSNRGTYRLRDGAVPKLKLGPKAPKVFPLSEAGFISFENDNTNNFFKFSQQKWLTREIDVKAEIIVENKSLESIKHEAVYIKSEEYRCRDEHIDVELDPLVQPKIEMIDEVNLDDYFIKSEEIYNLTPNENSQDRWL